MSGFVRSNVGEERAGETKNDLRWIPTSSSLAHHGYSQAPALWMVAAHVYTRTASLRESRPSKSLDAAATVQPITSLMHRLTFERTGRKILIRDQSKPGHEFSSLPLLRSVFARRKDVQLR